MEKFKQVYDRMIAFLTETQTLDPKMREYRLSFQLKMFGFEEMYHRTLEEARNTEEAEEKKNGTALNISWKKTIAYFEAYLNAIYSLLQVVTKITLIIYQKSKNRIETKDMQDSFGELRNYLKNVNRNADTELTKYLDQMTWYKAFNDNRRKISHDGSAFPMFDKDGKVEFVDYSRTNLRLFDKDGSVLLVNKPLKNLESYLKMNFDELFEFLDFYATHFQKWTS